MGNVPLAHMRCGMFKGADMYSICIEEMGRNRYFQIVHTSWARLKLGHGKSRVGTKAVQI